jgi:hypothetical protein
MTIKFASGIAAPGKTNLLIMSIAAAVLGLPAAASAEIVTATFTGTVNFVFDPDGGLPPASEGDAFVATYVFNLANATDTLIDPMTGGFSSGPYGSFVTATVSVNGTAGALPTFTRASSPERRKSSIPGASSTLSSAAEPTIWTAISRAQTSLGTSLHPPTASPTIRLTPTKL